MKFICSLIVVENIAKSRLLYEGILHQKVLTDFGANVAFEGGFALHAKDHFASLIGNKAILKESNNFELYFEDDGIELLEKELKANRFEFIHGIKEQPWKQRVIRFYDYDRHIIEIGERMEHVAFRLFADHMSLDEISAITYLSKDAVERAIFEYTKKES